jgi:hypothetical protein
MWYLVLVGCSTRHPIRAVCEIQVDKVTASAGKLVLRGVCIRSGTVRCMYLDHPDPLLLLLLLLLYASGLSAQHRKYSQNSACGTVQGRSSVEAGAGPRDDNMLLIAPANVDLD